MKEVSVILIYITIGFMTFGFTYNERVVACNQYVHQYDYDNCVWKAGSTFFPSIFWPVYWGGRLSIEVFK